MELWIEDWLQNVQQRLLDDTVANCWDAELSECAVRLGDFNSSHWLWPVTLLPKFAHESGDFFGQMFGKVRDALAVMAGCALVRLNLRKGLKKSLLLKQAVIETVVNACHTRLPALLVHGDDTPPAVFSSGPDFFLSFDRQYKVGRSPRYFRQPVRCRSQIPPAAVNVPRLVRRLCDQQCVSQPLPKKLSNERHPFAFR